MYLFKPRFHSDERIIAREIRFCVMYIPEKQKNTKRGELSSDKLLFFPHFGEGRNFSYLFHQESAHSLALYAL